MDAMPLKQADPSIDRDLRVLARFIDIYCRNKHTEAEKEVPVLKGFEMSALGIRKLSLCGSCSKLLSHAFVKRAHCPFNPKPACKHCEKHCYQPTYRTQIREVMRYSGRKLVLSGRLDLIFKLLF